MTIPADDQSVDALIASNVPADKMRAIGLLLDDKAMIPKFEKRLVELSASTKPGMFGMTVGDLASACLAAGSLKSESELSPLARSCLAGIRQS